MGTLSVDRLNQLITEAGSFYSWEDVLQNHGITKYETKDDGLVLTCPFHADKRPSFMINKRLGTYHCFSCGRKGTITRLMHELDGGELGYGTYCEQLLRSNKYLQDKLGFKSIFVDSRTLSPEFERRRTFSAKSHLAQAMPLSVLSQKVRKATENCTVEEQWKALVFAFSLLQADVSTDDVWGLFVKRGFADKKEGSGKGPVSLSSMLLDGGEADG